MKSKSVLVSLVGGGPGDPELITVKGLKAIKNADVILYDALISKELLNCARPQCIKVFVGKRKGKKEFEQEEINKLIVEYATRYKRVVRLKGGDSYVFGRGHEELEYVSKKGIDVEVIPGITSALAAPSLIGVPVTKRGVNESFMVITGTLSNDEISSDISIAAKTSATIIILMGMTHLHKIAKLMAELRSGHEPIAVIQNAATTKQKSVTGNASNIFSKAKAAGLDAPAVIVVGKVVAEGARVTEIIEQSKKRNQDKKP